MNTALSLSVSETLVLRPEQATLVNNVDAYFWFGKPKVVLAAGCGGGKTVMSIYLVGKYLQEHPDERVLILPYAQRILRNQYGMSLECWANSVGLSSSEYRIVESGRDFADAITAGVRCIVALPQTLKNLHVPHFGMLVVDEAHEWYFAKTMQKIEASANPTHTLLLTGTPAKFILHKYPLVAQSPEELLQVGRVCDSFVELATTSRHINNAEYNAENNLISKHTFTRKEVEEALAQVMPLIHARIVSRTKDPTKYHKLAARLKDKTIQKLLSSVDWANKRLDTQWLENYRASLLDKVLVACHDIDQANHFLRYFKDVGVKAVLSVSKDGPEGVADPDSEEISSFVKDDDIKVLIVVARGILGFDYDKLTYVVDATYSRNPTRILQLYLRLSRLHPDGREKLYIKLAPVNLAPVFSLVMHGTLSILTKRGYSRYNGTNFDDMPVVVKWKSRSSSGLPMKHARHRRLQTILDITRAAFGGLPVIRFMTSLPAYSDAVFNGYECTTFGEAIRAYNSALDKKAWTEEQLEFLEAAKKAGPEEAEILLQKYAHLRGCRA